MPLPAFKLPIASSSSSKPVKSKYSNVSQSSIFDLKGLVSEHRNTFQKEGRDPVKGEAALRRGKLTELSKDKFSRQSPNLARRLAQQAENDAKRARLYDGDEERITESERQEIMRRKAERYKKLRKGEEVASAESAIDFDRKFQEEVGFDHWSDHDSDVDESAQVPEDLRSGPVTTQRKENDNEVIEYIDELGRTRKGTRAEAREAEEAKRDLSLREEEKKREQERLEENGIGAAHAEVLQSNVIYGAQSYFPVYEPTQEELKARYRAAEGEPVVDHYDSKKEVRTKGAGFYQFAKDETIRAEQMENLKREREVTESVRNVTNPSPVLSAAQEAKKRKLEERRALIDSKRQKLVGGKEALDARRKQYQDDQADALLLSVEREMKQEEENESKPEISG